MATPHPMPFGKRLAPIAQVAVQRFTSPVRVPFAISKETRTDADLILVLLRDENGCVGLGECSPFASLTGDDAASILPLVQNLAEDMRGLSPPAALSELQSVVADLRSQSATAPVGVEIALYDLLARQLDIPLAVLFGTALQPAIKTDITLPIMGVDVVPSFYDLFQGYGFSTVKVKVSGNVTADLDMIQALLGCTGPGVAITLDGNQAFNEFAALRLLQELSRHEITPVCFEQPLFADDWAGLCRLSHASSVPICLDETVKSIDDVMRVIGEKVAPMINVKITKSGVQQGHSMAHLAKNAGLSVMIGGMLESEIAMGTSLQLACGSGLVDLADLDTPFFFTHHPCQTSPWLAQTAELICPYTVGHGMELDQDLASALSWR